MKNALLSPETAGANTTTLEGKTSTPTDVIHACESFPMFDKNRMVIVRDVPFNAGFDELSGYLKNVPGYTYLILTTDTPDKRRKLYKAIKETGEIVEFKPLDDHYLAKKAASIFKNANKQIESAALNMLVNGVKGDLGLLENEAEKLINYAGERCEINLNDIEKICSFTSNERVFDLLDALGAKDTKKALFVLSSILARGEQPISVLAMISNQLKIMLQCKLLSEAGYSLSELNSKLKAHPYVIKKSLAQSKNFTMEELLSILNRCRGIDVSIKTGHCEPGLALELLLAEVDNTK